MSLIQPTTYNNLLNGKDQAEGLIDYTVLDRVNTGRHQAGAEGEFELPRSSRRAGPTFSKTSIAKSMKNPAMQAFVAINSDANI